MSWHANNCRRLFPSAEMNVLLHLSKSLRQGKSNRLPLKIEWVFHWLELASNVVNGVGQQDMTSRNMIYCGPEILI